MEEATKVLESAYEKVSKSLFDLNTLDEKRREWISAIADACESQKAVTTALITSLVTSCDDIIPTVGTSFEFNPYK